MKRCAFVLLVGLGCRGGTTTGTSTSETYAHDIDKLCNVSALSGAGPGDPNGRTMLIAQWLASNLQTPEAHDYLIRIQPLEGVAKADALDAEAHRVGLPACPLAAEWRK